MSVSWIFFLFVPLLESLRIYFLCVDVRKLARQKGEPPLIWGLSTIGLWVGVEAAIVSIWWWWFDGQWMLGAVFIGISIAAILYSFLKKNLSRRPDVSLDKRIDEIGRHDESGS